MPPDALEGAPRKLSEVERVKARSRHLRGTIAETLVAADATHFGGGDANLLKFHGTYQQYDRDTATRAQAARAGKAASSWSRVADPRRRR